MKVYKILPHSFGCNSYLLTNDKKTAVVIDCAEPQIYEACIANNLKPVAVLLTHGHFDHVGGCGKFYKNGVPVCCGEAEKDYIFSKQNKNLFGGIPDFEIAKTFIDGEQFEFGGIKFKAVSTPGHTAGGVCYIAEDCLFSGDTLFWESVGRCDLPTGNNIQLVQSVKKLFALEGDYKVYCGHEQETTLDHERKFNPYVKNL